MLSRKHYIVAAAGIKKMRGNKKKRKATADFIKGMRGGKGGKFNKRFDRKRFKSAAGVKPRK
jgi:hypothetical protein